MPLDLQVLLAILKEVSVIIQALRDMGVKVSGEIHLADLLKLTDRVP